MTLTAIKFVCRYCPKTFAELKDLVSHYERRHNTEGQEYRDIKDAIGYVGNDSGCKIATDYLGHQSSCLKCPFPKCKLEERGVGIKLARKRTRNEEIIQRYQAGEGAGELAIEFHTSKRTIQRVVRA